MRIKQKSNECNSIQNELDKIESKILIKLFGQTAIPDNSAVVLKLFGIDPNKYIHLFEKNIKPIMKPDGSLDGKLLRKIISFSKYKDATQIFNIPDSDFFLSDYIEPLFKKIIPGGNK